MICVEGAERGFMQRSRYALRLFQGNVKDKRGANRIRRYFPSGINGTDGA